MRLANGLLTLCALLLLASCIESGEPGGGTTSGSTSGHNGSSTAVSGSWGNAPDFSYTTFDGRRQMLSDNLGQPLVVNFWAVW